MNVDEKKILNVFIYRYICIHSFVEVILCVIQCDAPIRMRDPYAIAMAHSIDGYVVVPRFSVRDVRLRSTTIAIADVLYSTIPSIRNTENELYSLCD